MFDFVDGLRKIHDQPPLLSNRGRGVLNFAKISGWGREGRAKNWPKSVERGKVDECWRLVQVCIVQVKTVTRCCVLFSVFSVFCAFHLNFFGLRECSWHFGVKAWMFWFFKF